MQSRKHLQIKNGDFNIMTNTYIEYEEINDFEPLIVDTFGIENTTHEYVDEYISLPRCEEYV